MGSLHNVKYGAYGTDYDDEYQIVLVPGLTLASFKAAR